MASHSPGGPETARMVNRAVTGSTVAYQILKPRLLADVDYYAYPAAIVDRVNLDAARSKARQILPWFDVDGLIKESMKLADNNVWKEVMARSHTNTVNDVAQAFNTTPDNIPNEISERNSAFYGFMPALALTAAFGMNITDILTPEINGITSHWAILEAAGHFKTPAANKDEFLARMQELFPAADAQQAQFSAFAVLDRNGAFVGSNMECPVKKPTQYFFEAFGMALQDPEYQALFLDRTKSAELKRKEAEEARAIAAERAAWEQARARRTR